jgi:hypothetical protein
VGSDDNGSIVPFNMKAMRTVMGPQFEEDSAAIEAWIRGGPKPDFADIGSRLLSIYSELDRRGWYHPDDFVTDAVSAVRKALHSEKSDLAGLVARLVEVTRGLLKEPPPNRPRRGGPKAAQMSLGKKA